MLDCTMSANIYCFWPQSIGRAADGLVMAGTKAPSKAR